ncbi:chromate transporter-domain-containing protein [Aspergillus cavernicola]|uniref:Chromate transporter-domain-containing protein n=1 Tax=Aspergillus cavernicola TaxID=176166 RepID=A0ABR4HYN7_9EURO
MQLPPPLPCCLSALHTLNRRLQQHTSSEPNGHGSLFNRLCDVFFRTWHLGLTSFGGLAVHFQTLHGKFVEGRGGQERWIDEQTYQELSAICQALPGPASTKMLFCIALLHAGFIPALLALALWCLPGAVGMYALSIGVQNMGDTLPRPAYALLSGLNASTVGIVALSAVQLAEKVIRDQLTRGLVIFGACAGLCYNAVWYFPVLMISGGLVTVIWDGWLSQLLRKARVKWRQRNIHPEAGEETAATEVELQEQNGHLPRPSTRNETVRSRKMCQATETCTQNNLELVIPPQVNTSQDHIIKIRVGLFICAIFFASFIGVIVARAVTASPPLTLDLFANMYLAGTIIFGGGPVVIPLLRSYVVDPGWVSGRDFLIGLALIQAFPGPNFNFAVFLGSLAMSSSQFPSILGALLGLFGIYLPGIILAVSVQSFWRVLRRRKWVVDFLRGINATAIGLVFTAVYRLWEVGYLTSDASNGQSLAKEPWWVVVAAVSYAGNAWFRVPPAFAIISGAVLGLGWYGVVRGG